MPDQADIESRAHSTHAASLRLWLRMLTCTNLIETQVRSQLRQQFGITLPRFDLLAQLERAPQGLKMGELSKRMMVTGGNVTGITDQLCEEGLVERLDNPQDRRAYIVKLTSKGQRVFAEMAKAHEDWIVELFAGLAEEERQTFYKLLATLKTHVKQSQAGDTSKPARRETARNQNKPNATGRTKAGA